AVEITGPVPSGDSTAPGIDGLTWGDLGLHINQTVDAAKRASVRQAETTTYGNEPVSVKKRGLKQFNLRFFFHEATYEDFVDRVQTLCALLSAPGARTLRLADGTYREIFIKDGFTISNVMVQPGKITAILYITVSEIRQLKNWNMLTNGEGVIITDGRGRPLTDILKWI